MNKKQRDLKKLKAYSKALGLKTFFKQGSKNHPSATWDTNLNLIFYIRSYTTKQQLLLNYIHELSHMRHWTASGKINDDMLFDALNTEDNRTGPYDHKVDKSMRKLIYEDEKEATTFRQDIRKQLDLESVSEQDVELDIKLDIWIYNYYYQKGEFPTLSKVYNARLSILRSFNTKSKRRNKNV